MPPGDEGAHLNRAKPQEFNMLAERFAVARPSSTSTFHVPHLGRVLLMMLCLCVFALQALAADPEISPRDLKGIPKRHKYVTSILAGAAIGAGLGILAPGGNRSLVKGMLIGGSGASTLYHWSHRNAAGEWTQWPMSSATPSSAKLFESIQNAPARRLRTAGVGMIR